MPIKQITSSRVHPSRGSMKEGEWRFAMTGGKVGRLFHKFSSILHEFWAGEPLFVDGSNKMKGGSIAKIWGAEIRGDVDFVGGGGFQYGEIYASDNAVETAIAVANTWYQVTIFDTDGLSNGSVTPDHTNDHITIGKAGHYMALFSASVLSAAGAAFDGEFEVKKNNGGTDLTNVHTDRDLAGGGGDHGSISMNGIIDCAVDDTIELWVKNKTNTTNLVFEDVTLSIVQIGGT